MSEEKVKDSDLKTIAVLRVDGNIETIAATSIPNLRKELRKYPASALIEVWRGRKLELKREVKVSF